MNYEELKNLALESGFTHAAPLDTATIELKQDVRDMCAQGCQQYAKRWSCPPGCGTLDQLRGSIYCYKEGILVQTVTKLEDEFDWDGMIKAQNLHQEHFLGVPRETPRLSFFFPATRNRMLHALQNLHLPGCTLPLPAKKDFFDGSMWYVGIGSMSEE